MPIRAGILTVSDKGARGERTDTAGPAVAALLDSIGAEAAAVSEAFLTPASPEDEIDSVATWTAPDGATWLIATAKETHRLVVYDADTGERRLHVGGPGDGPGQFNRPNGIATFGDLLFVVANLARKLGVEPEDADVRCQPELPAGRLADREHGGCRLRAELAAERVAEADAAVRAFNRPAQA